MAENAEMAEQLKQLWKQLEKKEEQLEKKDKTLLEQLEKKDKTLLEQLDKKDQLHADLMKQRGEIAELEIRNNKLQQELKERKTAYLRVTGCLHLRSVCEEFEKSIAILADKGSTREKKWKSMLECEEYECARVQKCLVNCNLKIEQVPKIAKELFDKINTAVHGDFRKSHQDLHIVTNYFSRDELTLIDCIIECYGIEKVVYVRNTSNTTEVNE